MTREDLIRRYNECQSYLTEGCLFLSLCSIIEEVTDKPLDILDALAYAKSMNYIDSKHEMSVKGQIGLLQDLTGKHWLRKELKVLPIVVPEQMYTIEKWYNKNTGFTHFRRRYMDTLTKSVTVVEGKQEGYYAYIHEV